MSRICKILIVENDDDVRRLLGDIIEDEGYHFSSVKNSDEMRSALDADDYDIAIIDITLPGGEDGFALAEFARQQGCGVILVTGDYRHLDRLAAGEQPYLLKPFRILQLIDTVDKVLAATAAQCMRRKRSDGSVFPARMG